MIAMEATVLLPDLPVFGMHVLLAELRVIQKFGERKMSLARDTGKP